MSRSPEAIAKRSAKLCALAAGVAHKLDKEGRVRESRYIMQLVQSHQQASKKIAELFGGLRERNR